MPDEFFSSADAKRVRPLPTLNPRCDRCKLYRSGCKSPKMRVDGAGRKRVMIVSDYPGKSEDLEGRPFVGGTGRWLESELGRLGFDMRRDAWLTNALICYSPDKSQPTTAVDDCRPNLLRAIKQYDPVVIILMGGLAVQSLIGHLWKPDVGPISRWTGRMIPAHKPNAWVCPMNNPAYVLKEKASPVDKMQFREALAGAVAKTARPWPDGPPDFASQVECIHSPTEAARRLKRYTGGTIAFDVETDRLKPDHRDAAIVCCSVCWEGQETIAFPWHGPVIPEMRRILLDPKIGKIASNLDMEDRWMRAKLGIDVQGWKFDTMLAAHLLDARRGGGGDGAERGSGCTGLKFLSFVRLGVPDYNGHLEEFLKPKESGGNSPNRVRDLKLDTLMHYCAEDSLYEWLIAQQMMAEMGIAS